MNDWISTADKLPDDDEAVLVATDDGEVWTGHTDAGEWYYPSGDRIGHVVTHWMGFPAPPGASAQEPVVGAGIAIKWRLIFSTEGGTEAHIFADHGDPQESAIIIRNQYPFLRLIAAVEYPCRILIMDNARTAECGLEGWPG